VTTTTRSGKKVGRKSYVQSDMVCVWLAQKYSQGGQRSLREVAYLLAHMGLRTRSGTPYGPAAVRKMLQTQFAPKEQKTLASWWEHEGRAVFAERVLGVQALRPDAYRKAVALKKRAEYHWKTGKKRNTKRTFFQWLIE